MYIDGTFNVVEGYHDNAIRVYEDTVLSSDSTSTDDNEFTVEWLCKYIDTESSDDWFADGSWHAFALRRSGLVEEFLVDGTSVEYVDDKTSAYEDFNIYIDSTDYVLDTIRITDEWRTNDNLMSLDTMTSSYIHVSFHLGVLADTIAETNFYLDSIATSIEDYDFIHIAPNDSWYDGTSSIHVIAPAFTDGNMFLPTPGYYDIDFLAAMADYKDESFRIPILGISHEYWNSSIPILAVDYVDSGDAAQGFILYVDVEFGHTEGFIFITVTTDNLVDAGRVLVDSRQGYGSMSPVMLEEFGPWFGTSQSYRPVQHDWERYLQRHYGYNTLAEAEAAMVVHDSSAAILVERVIEPPSSSWYIIRWRETEGGNYNYIYFDNLGDTNTRKTELENAGKYDVEARIWETTMPYFPVFTITAAYPLATSDATQEDLNELDIIEGFTWTTVVSDNDLSTQWHSEDGKPLPHWLRVIF
jgi:hypothetical protein